MDFSAIVSFISTILLAFNPASKNEDLQIPRGIPLSVVVQNKEVKDLKEKQGNTENKKVLGVKKVGETEIIGEKYIPPSPSPGVYRNSGVSVKQQPLEELFLKYGGEYGVDPNLLKKICNCESHCNPNAVNGYYAGMYQYTPGSWKSTRNAMGLDPNPDLRFNAEESIKTTAFKIANGGINAWPNCH